ncbi:hypothetical protein D3C83_250620 [compost metagenome]
MERLEVTGVVLPRERVFPAAGRGDDARELAGWHLFCAFEHHVFEHVCHAGSAIHFICASNAVPDH